MSQPEVSVVTSEDSGPNWIGLWVAIASALLTGLFWGLHYNSPSLTLKILFLCAEVVLISVAIWQVCDPFADAAQWIGQRFEIPGSVRGATLDAIASSLPELFSGIFFVVLAISAVKDDPAAIAGAGAEGFGSTIATCAGSAVYNMMLIPAFCALFISVYRKSRPTIDIEDEVISRDGVWFVACELLLILFLFQDRMYWWMGLVLIGLYGVYVLQLYFDTAKFRRALAETKAEKEELAQEAEEEVYGDEEIDEAGVFFGFLEVGLNLGSALGILLVATFLAAGCCYFLVEATREAALTLDVPIFFVAVIIAAAASSVPDTFLSIGAAMRGDDSGAVSNAFGSNIFDICICLSVPLLVNSYLTNWEPVLLLQDGKPIAGLVGLRVLLVVLTIITLLIVWHKRQLTRRKALFLIALYFIFIGYAVCGSLGFEFLI